MSSRKLSIQKNLIRMKQYVGLKKNHRVAVYTSIMPFVGMVGKELFRIDLLMVFTAKQKLFFSTTVVTGMVAEDASLITEMKLLIMSKHWKKDINQQLISQKNFVTLVIMLLKFGLAK